MRSSAALGLLFSLPLALLVPAIARPARGVLQDNQTRKLKFSFGRYWNGCGPVDRPESGIILTTVLVKCTKRIALPPPPYLSVQFSGTGAKTAPIRVVWWKSPTGSATVVRCLTAGSKCDQAVGGTIDFGTSGSPAKPPSYELKFADGSLEGGTFAVRMACQRVTCW
jgi:hypothetical protein